MKTTLNALVLGGALVAASMLTTPAAAADIDNWQKEVVRAVASKQVYPRSALRREIEGRAKVAVTVDRNGKIVDFEIVQDTGEAVLDREVPRLMERIDPLPAPPAAAGENDLSFVLPLAWVLR